MNISIFASIGSENLGDELILKNEVKMLEKEYGKNTKFTVFSYDYKNPFFKKSNIIYKEYFPIGLKNFFNLFRNIKNFFIFLLTVYKSDLIVIGGGGILYDGERQAVKEPLAQWLFRTNVFRLFNKKIIFFAVGLNIHNNSSYYKIKKIFSDAYKVTVRNNYSYNLLKELGIKSELVRDPVFYDNGKHGDKSFMIKGINSHDFSYKDLEGLDLEGKKIAIAFREGFLCDKGNNLHLQMEEGKINELINYILKKGGEVILLPHSFHKTDYLANDYVFLNQFLRINEKIRIISSMNDVYNKYIYREFDMCLAMRLHSMILSQVYEIPFIGVSYSVKTDELLNELSD